MAKGKETIKPPSKKETSDASKEMRKGICVDRKPREFLTRIAIAATAPDSAQMTRKCA
jgi:LDH2 family malate/lactate/ureidoglycolate dehydrogenase